MNLGGIPRTPFQAKLDEAARQVSWGLVAVEPGDPRNLDMTISSVSTASKLVDEALRLPAPDVAKAEAAKAASALIAAHDTLAESDDDGYPLHMDAGIQQTIAAVNLVSSAASAGGS
jgi:hypothetical protein